mmetsp:Transcript_68881/g.155814  ORF Transcript_68881/g.155814 Transcript_68881/m.155814 type:complete len:230 (-) Transcript_68881:550-1239(-)
MRLVTFLFTPLWPCGQAEGPERESSRVAGLAGCWSVLPVGHFDHLVHLDDGVLHLAVDDHLEDPILAVHAVHGALPPRVVALKGARRLVLAGHHRRHLRRRDRPRAPKLHLDGDEASLVEAHHLAHLPACAQEQLGAEAAPRGRLREGVALLLRLAARKGRVVVVALARERVLPPAGVGVGGGGQGVRLAQGAWVVLSPRRRGVARRPRGGAVRGGRAVRRHARARRAG